MIETVPADAPPLKLNVPSYRVPVQCAAIVPVACPFEQAIVKATFVALIEPSAVITGVITDHVSWMVPCLSVNPWPANVIGAGYCAVAHALKSS